MNDAAFEKAIRFLELSQNDTLTPKEVEKFVVMVLEFITRSRAEFNSISSETLNKLKEAMASLDAVQANWVGKSSVKLQGMIDEVNRKATEVKDIVAAKPKDGVSPDPVALALEASNLVVERLKPFIPTFDTLSQEVVKMGASVRDALEILNGQDKLTIEALREWPEIKKELERLARVGNYNIAPQVGAVAGARDLFKDIDLSTSLDGLTTTFNIPAVYNIISVDLSSFPYGSLRKNVDYTYTPTSVTFTSQIDPSTQLSAGQSCVLTVVAA